MTTDALASLACQDWLADSPFQEIVAHYISVLHAQRYAERTINIYVRCLGHFSQWMKAETLDLSSIDSALIERFVRVHLPSCNCSSPHPTATGDTRAALRHLLPLLPKRPAPATDDPIAAELALFGDYLANTCGLAPVTCAGRLKYVGAFLIQQFGSHATPKVSQLAPANIDDFLRPLALRWKPATIKTVCNSLRSYFHFRALLGEPTATLSAALPRIADWRHANLPKVLSDTQLDAFLKAFDRSDPVGLRDYAIARCLVDLGLRGQEVTDLTLESVDLSISVQF